MLTVDLKAFVPVHADSDSQIQVSQSPVFKLGFNEPAVGTEALGKASAHGEKRAAEVSGQVDEMTTVGEHVVADLIGFGIDIGLERPRSRTWKRLYRVGHGVAMGGVTVPGFQGQHLSHPVVYEAVRCFYAGIEAEHVAHLEYKATLLHLLRQ